MGIKVIKQELEARLDPVVSTSFFSRPRAKIESKLYGDGTKRFKLKISNLKIADGSEVELVINDNVINSLKVAVGKTELDLKSEDDLDIPVINNHDLAEIRHNDETVLK